VQAFGQQVDVQGQRLVGRHGRQQFARIAALENVERALAEQFAHLFPPRLLIPGSRQTHTFLLC
jgi:hypothetical protein